MIEKISYSKVKTLIQDENYVFLNTDSGYDPEKKNSIKEYFKIPTLEAQNHKKNPKIQQIISDARNRKFEFVDDEDDTCVPAGETNNKIEALSPELV